MPKRERDMSIAARLWLAADAVCPPLSNQLLIEGSGKFDRELWQKAVDRVAEVNNGCRLVLRGHMGWSHWVDSGQAPPVRLVEAGSWDGFSSEGAPFTQPVYSPRKGPMAEVVLIQGDPLRVVFRSHHAIMDGRGTLTWAEDIFRVLRGENPLPAVTDISEKDLLNLGDSKRHPALPHRYLAPGGKASGTGSGIVWRRKRIKGRYPKLLIQMMLLTAREAWKHGSGPVKLSIPVDMRPRREGLCSYGNLTSSLYIEVSPDSTVESLEKEITARLNERYDGQITWEDKILPHVPLFLLQTALKAEARKNHRQGGYRLSGIISNMGRYSLENYQGGGFVPNGIWGVPVCIDAIPFSAGMISSGENFDVIITMPRVLADDDRLENMLNTIMEGFKTSL